MNFSSSSNMNVYPQSYPQAAWQAPQHPEAPAIAQSTYITEDADSRVRLSAPSKLSHHMSLSSNQPRSFIARPPSSQDQPSSSSGSPSIPSSAAAHLRHLTRPVSLVRSHQVQQQVWMYISIEWLSHPLKNLSYKQYRIFPGPMKSLIKPVTVPNQLICGI